MAKRDLGLERGKREIEAKIGERVRAARLLAGMSQTDLAEKLAVEKGGLTFQQLQKYEKGTNRVAVSRLIEIAHCTGQPISFFLPDDESAEAVVGLDRIDLTFARKISAIPQPLKAKVAAMIDALVSAAA